MTIAFACDGPGCGRRMSRTDRRLELNDLPAIAGTADTSDPDALIVEVPELRTGADACDRHFCSWECVAAWATAQIIDHEKPGDTAP